VERLLIVDTLNRSGLAAIAIVVVSQILQDLSRDGSIESTFSRYGVPYHDPFPGE
jgi:hypothetical protein